MLCPWWVFPEAWWCLMKSVCMHLFFWGLGMPPLFLLFYRMMVLICYDRYIAYSMCSWQNLVSFQHGLFRVSFLGDPWPLMCTNHLYRKSGFLNFSFFSLVYFLQYKKTKKQTKTLKTHFQIYVSLLPQVHHLPIYNSNFLSCALEGMMFWPTMLVLKSLVKHMCSSVFMDFLCIWIQILRTDLENWLRTANNWVVWSMGKSIAPSRGERCEWENW